MYVPATTGVDKLLRPLSKDSERRPSRRAASADPEPASEDAELPADADDGEPLGYSRMLAEPVAPLTSPGVQCAADDASAAWDVLEKPEARASNSAGESPSTTGSAFYDLLEQAAKG